MGLASECRRPWLSVLGCPQKATEGVGAGGGSGFLEAGCSADKNADSQHSSAFRLGGIPLLIGVRLVMSGKTSGGQVAQPAARGRAVGSARAGQLTLALGWRSHTASLGTGSSIALLS